MALELLTPFTKVELETKEKKPIESKLGYWVVTLTQFTMLT